MTRKEFDDVFDVLTKNTSEGTRSTLRQHCLEHWSQISETKNSFALLEYLREARLKMIEQYLDVRIDIQNSEIRITTTNPGSLEIFQLPFETTDFLIQLKIAREDLLLALRIALAKRSEDFRRLCEIPVSSFGDLISEIGLEELEDAA